MWIRLFVAGYVVLCMLLVTAVLLQPGKGFGLESAQSGGSSSTIFGSVGPIATLKRATVWLFSGFLLYSLVLGGVLTRASRNHSVQSEMSEEIRQLVESESAANALESELIDNNGQSEDPSPESQETDQTSTDEEALPPEERSLEE